MLQQASDSVQRQLNLHEIADLVDPAAGLQDMWARELLYTTSLLALTDANTENLDPTEAAVLSWVAMGLQPDEDQEPARVSEDLLLTHALTNSAVAFLGAEAQRTVYPFDDHDQLIQVITTFMDPPFENSGASLKVEDKGDGPILISYLTKEQQAWLERFLEYQRGEMAWQGLVRVEVLQGDLDRLTSIDPEMRLSLMADPALLEERRAALKKSDFQILNDAKLLLNPYHDGELRIAEQISYVSDWSLYTVQPGGMEVADPTVEMMEEGLELECRIWQAEEGSYGIHLDLSYSEIQQPIPTHDLAVEGAHGLKEFTISAPELRSTDVEADVRVMDGTGLQLVAQSPDSNQDIVLLISFRAISTEE